MSGSEKKDRSPLASVGFNENKETEVDEFLESLKNINFLYYIFSSKKRKLMKRKIFNIECMGWYLRDNDERRIPRAEPSDVYEQKQSDFPQSREQKSIPFFKRDIESNFSARFEPDFEKPSKSIWIIYESDKELMRSSLEDIWGETNINPKIIRDCSSESYAQSIFRKLRESGVERMYHIMTGKIWKDELRKKEDEPYQPTNSNRLESSEHE